MAIIDVLAKAKKDGTMVATHINPADQSSCSVGFVYYVDENWYILKSYAPDGSDDGYEIRRTNDLFRVDMQGVYESKIEFLSKHHQEFRHRVEIPTIKSNDNLIGEILQALVASNAIGVFWTTDDDDSIIGFVKEYDSEWVTVQIVDDYGRVDSLVAVKHSEIRAIDFNSKKCQIINFLHQKFIN
ncbi:hypothetical protein [Megalodesulfovibrio gigas]|uniref:Uncharacterized protein n=1 Tax=Megalodesulfovibrio gigas (strain ATCC 19364 / DSM 1382 / NCIMB 9332 / VKM B-1759) TaxID=1121448 RepID=T2GDJ5_MEGG1|nr:hypothetical protein [Megalodesulfovibrio gigas]AGW14186.1 hypothetical protein DGI_2442 [Megalodesulfovibrio gigas DSM 1382 = ATCC 19364]